MGFTPRMVIVKRFDGVGGWYMYDAFRGSLDGTYQESPYVLANSAASEVFADSHHIQAGDGFFKFPDWARTGVNSVGETYLYCAFA